MRHNRINDLPDELLREILRFTAEPLHERLGCILVCRRWKLACFSLWSDVYVDPSWDSPDLDSKFPSADKKLVLHLRMDNLDESEECAALSVVARLSNRCEGLILRCRFSTVPRVFHTIASTLFKHLQLLKIYESRPLYVPVDEQLDHPLPNPVPVAFEVDLSPFPSLRTFQLNIDSASVIDLSFRQARLNSLFIRYSDSGWFHSDRQLWSILEPLQSLEHVDLLCPTMQKAPIWADFDALSMPRLRHLAIDASYISDDPRDHLIQSLHAPQLEVLHLRCSETYSGARRPLSRLIGDFEHVRELYLIQFPQWVKIIRDGSGMCAYNVQISRDS